MLRWFRCSSPAMPTGEDVAASVDPLIDYLVSQISTPARASSVLGRVAEYRVLPPSEQEQALPALYLLLEEYLVEIDSMRKLTREQLRKLSMCTEVWHGSGRRSR